MRGVKNFFPCLTAGLPVLRNVIFNVSGPQKIFRTPDAGLLGHPPVLFRLGVLAGRSIVFMYRTGAKQKKILLPALP